MKNIIIWLCGLWAFGLGLRCTIELLASDGWIHVPKHPLNIYFDFLPLCILGLLTAVFETKEMIEAVKKMKSKRRDGTGEMSESETETETKTEMRSAGLSITTLLGLVGGAILICPICTISVCGIGAASFLHLPAGVIETAVGVLIFSSAINVNRVLKSHFRRNFKGQLTAITVLFYLLVLVAYRLGGVI